jgi:tetratricopeptide (TPR) repeat protein
MNSTESPVKIGTDLEVNYLLNGIYQLSGDRIKIDVELIDTQTGRSIWNLSFNRLFDDIFEIQSSIASKVYSQFSLTDTPSNELPTKNLEAYAHYLKAQQIFYGENRIGESLAESIEHLNLAIQLDSSFLDAYLRMASYKTQAAKSIKERHGVNEEYKQLVSDIMRLSSLVDERFPNTWKRIRLHAQITYMLDEDFDEAIQLFSEVLQYDPEDFGANAYLGAIYKRKLMQKEALKYHFRARQLDPGAAILWNEIAQDYLSMGDYPSCMKSLENRLKLGLPFQYGPHMEPAQTQFYLFSTGKWLAGKGFELPNAVNKKFFQRDYRIRHFYQLPSQRQSFRLGNRIC